MRLKILLMAKKQQHTVVESSHNAKGSRALKVY